MIVPSSASSDPGESFLLFTLLAFLLFRFLLRACGLVQSRQVYLSDDINLRNKLRLMYLEDFFSFFFPSFQPVLLQPPVREQALLSFFLLDSC